MPEWIDQAVKALALGPTAMVTVLATEGSAPRGAGTRMIVNARGCVGTIGGGHLEYQACEQARAILGYKAGTWRVQDYPLGPLLGQCCGGRVRLLVEHLDPTDLAWIGLLTDGVVLITHLNADRVARMIGDPKLPPTHLSARGDRPSEGSWWAERIGRPRRPVFLFGAGHVGRAIASAFAPLPFSLAWFDSRLEFASQPGVFHVDEEDLPECARSAPTGAALLILTHDHGLDYRLVAAGLSGTASFVGLIGSKTKRARFLSRLREEHIDTARLVCPIGLAGIIGKEPEIIAAATVAQLLTLREAA